MRRYYCRQFCNFAPLFAVNRFTVGIDDVKFRHAMNLETDYLVIGSGAAGLSFALKAAEHSHVIVVTKGEMNECNTNYAHPYKEVPGTQHV